MDFIGDHFEFFYKLTITIVGPVSVGCLAFHLYKFSRSANPQSLANKNLALYCFLLFINNIINIRETEPFMEQSFSFQQYDKEDRYYYIKHSESSKRNYAMIFIQLYFASATAFYKFIIALEICLCFRNIAVYLQKPAGPQNMKFFICMGAGLGIPVIQTFSLYFVSDVFVNLFRFLTIVRVSRLFLVFYAFRYLRSASIDKSELWTKFGLHMRLLLMIGGISAIFSVIEVYAVIALSADEFGIGSISYVTNNVGGFVEAITIVILFTFKESTFKPVGG